MTVGSYISRSWQLFWRYPVVFFLGGWVASLVASSFPLILLGPIMCGIMFATLKAQRGQIPEFGDLFRGFDRFADGLLAGLIVSVILGVGLVLCLLPALFLAPFFTLTYAFVIDRGLPWDKAISASWQAARANYGKFLGFTLLSFLFSLLGLLVCCVGILITQPIAIMAAAIFYADVTGTLGGGDTGVEPSPAPAEA